MGFWLLNRLSRNVPSRPKASGGWTYIGNNRDTSNIPDWVINAFASEPGSHGTRLIDYPEGPPIYYKGRTFRYKIVMGSRSWDVYRRRRKSKRRKRKNSR